MAVRNPNEIPRDPDGHDFDDSPILLGGDRTTDPAPYSNRVQLYSKRDADGYLDTYILDERGRSTRLTSRGVDRYGVVNVKDYGATGNGQTDDTDALVEAFAAADASGATIYLPYGSYKHSTTLNVPTFSRIRGDGKFASQLIYTGVGRGIQSINPINSSNAVDIQITGLGITCNNASNADGGFVDVCGTYIVLRDVYINGFLYGVVLDQSELVDLDDMHIVAQTWIGSGPKPRSVWIVNGDDYSAGASPGFTNRISIIRSQFNAADTENNYHIVDDGGGVHSFRDNNFNSAGCAIRACGVGSLNIDMNESEGHEDCAFNITDSTLDASRYVGPCQALCIKTNSLAPNAAAPAAIKVTAAFGGEITNNIFANTNGIYLVGNPHKSANLRIAGNQMHTFSLWGGFSIIVADSFLTATKQHMVEQTATTRVTDALTAGANTVTPSSMVGISLGKTLACVNANGTNFELVNVTATTDTTFTATFASNKSASWKIQGVDPNREDSGTWTPTLKGDGAAGSHTYSVRKGGWHRIGKRVFVTCNLTVSALDAAISGQLYIDGLPFAPIGLNADVVVPIPWFQGVTLGATRTGVWGFLSGTNIMFGTSRPDGLSVAPMTHAEITGTFSMYFTFEYIAAL